MSCDIGEAMGSLENELRLNDAFWQQMDWTWRPNSLVPSLTCRDTIGFPFLVVHENPSVRDSRGDTTRSCGTNENSSWSLP